MPTLSAEEVANRQQTVIQQFVGQTLLSPLPATAELLQRQESLGNRAGQDLGQIKL